MKTNIEAHLFPVLLCMLVLFDKRIKGYVSSSEPLLKEGSITYKLLEPYGGCSLELKHTECIFSLHAWNDALVEERAVVALKKSVQSSDLLSVAFTRAPDQLPYQEKGIETLLPNAIAEWYTKFEKNIRASRPVSDALLFVNQLMNALKKTIPEGCLDPAELSEMIELFVLPFVRYLLAREEMIP